MRTVDATIGTLIKQINGVVAGQDTRIEDLKEKLNQAIEEKQATLEQAKEREDAAKEFEAEIRKADAENVRLQMELEQLKSRMNNKIDIFEKIGLIKLTKENRQILLDSNEGFSFQLSYNSRKGGAREREYKITNGNLYIHEAKISDELYERICLENGKDKGAGYNCMYSAPLCIITQGMIHQPLS